MQLSTIIVSWNTRDLLARCLESLFAHPPRASFEVLVIDNASSDGSSEAVQERFPQVRLIQNAENSGFAAATNRGILESDGTFILLLNPDTEIQAGALQTLLDVLESHPEYGMVGPRLLNPDGSLQESCYPAPTLSREVWRLFHLDRLVPHAIYPMSKWSPNQIRSVDVLKGACVLLRREVIEQVGLLDESFFMYSEEVDLCLRVRRAGWQLAWVPQACVIHYEGQSTRQASREMFIRLYAGKVGYYRKHHGWWSVQAYKLILLLASLVRLAITPLAFFEHPPARQAHLALSGKYRRLLSVLYGL